MTRGPSFLHTPAPATTDHPVLRKRPPPSDPLGHVLIVDDNEINLRVAKSLCELLGMTSEFARDGLDAVDAATNGAFDLILMDICMPGSSHRLLATRRLISLSSTISTWPSGSDGGGRARRVGRSSMDGAGACRKDGP